jgi:hypothetical protein
MAFNWFSNEKSRMNEEPPNYAEATAASAHPSPSITSTPSNATSTSLADARAPLKGSDTKYAMLSIAGSDRIRLLRFPEPMTALLSEIVQGLWPKGIQKVQKFDESLELKLRGNPFAYGQDEEKVAIRITLMGILNAFSKEGWVVPPSGGRIGRLGNYGSYGQKGEQPSFFLFFTFDIEYSGWAKC